VKKLLLFITAIFICGAAIAQTETTKWYIEGELYDTTSCESGNDITMPQVPERFGYTFSGWEPAVYDMSTLDATINGDSTTESGKKFKCTFSYGAIYGESLCSPTSNNQWYNNALLDTETGSGRYCWCRIVEFIPVGSSVIYDTLNSPWEFESDVWGSSQDCAVYCSRKCSGTIKSNTNFRSKLYGIN